MRTRTKYLSVIAGCAVAASLPFFGWGLGWLPADQAGIGGKAVVAASLVAFLLSTGIDRREIERASTALERFKTGEIDAAGKTHLVEVIGCIILSLKLNMNSSDNEKTLLAWIVGIGSVIGEFGPSILRLF